MFIRKSQIGAERIPGVREILIYTSQIENSELRQATYRHSVVLQNLKEERDSLIKRKRQIERSLRRKKIKIPKLRDPRAIESFKEKSLANRLREEISKAKNVIENTKKYSDSILMENLLKEIFELEKEQKKFKRLSHDVRNQTQRKEKHVATLESDLRFAESTGERTVRKLREKLSRREELIVKMEAQRKELLKQLGRTTKVSSSTMIEYEKRIKQLKKSSIKAKIELIGLEKARKVSDLPRTELNISRTSWLQRLFTSKPEIMELREQLCAVRGHSFSIMNDSEPQSRPFVINKETIIQLIAQHYENEGRNQLANKISESFSVRKLPSYQQSHLHSLIRLATRDVNSLWAEEIRKEEDKPLKLPSDDISIWHFNQNDIVPYDCLNSDNIFENLQLASINKIVELITRQSGVDKIFKNAVIITYRTFMNPEHLLLKLFQRFQVPSNQNEKSKESIQLRVTMFLKSWIQSEQLSPRILQAIENWAKSIAMLVAPNKAKAVLMILKRESSSQKSSKSSSSSNTIPPPPKIPRNIFSTNLSLNDIEPEEFSRQLTLMVSNTFRAIQYSELVNGAWSKKKTKHLAPNVINATSKFNQIVGYIVSKILEPDRVRDRGRILTKFLKIIISLNEFRNYEHAMALVTAINNSAISRLQYTQDEVPKILWRQFDEIEASLSSNEGYKTYRKTLDEALNKGPTVPFIGMWLTDITFTIEASESKSNGLISWGMRKQLFKIIEKIQEFQNEEYSFAFIQQIQKLLKKDLFPNGNLKALYQRSLEVEPRDAPKSSIKF